jgi:hypothetical protein
MTEIPENQPPAVPAAFKDRRAGLGIMGGVQGLGGVLVLLMGLAVLFTDSLTQVAGSVAFVWAIGIFLLWTGRGVSQAQRWARGLMLVASWIGLIAAILFVAKFGICLMASKAQSNVSSQSCWIQMVKLVIGLIMLTAIFVSVPLSFLLFFRSPHVKATCEWLHPDPCWIDRCPLTVLAAVFFALTSCPFLLASAMTGTPLPFFGLMLFGGASLAGSLVLAALYGYAAWGCYQLKMSAWWILQSLMFFQTISTVVTVEVVGMGKYYQANGIPPEKLDKVLAGPLSNMTVFITESLLTLVLTCGYLMWIRRHFVKQSQ